MPEPRQSNAQARFILRQNRANLIISKMRHFTWNATTTAEIMAKTLSMKQIQSLETMMENVQDALLKELEKPGGLNDW